MNMYLNRVHVQSNEPPRSKSPSDFTTRRGDRDLLYVPNYQDGVTLKPLLKSPEKDALEKKQLLTDQERESLLTFEADLGKDPSSEHFTKRTKGIGFMIKVHGIWFQLNQDYFNQNADYNDFSGGYKRFYDTLPSEFVRNPGTIKILNAFQKEYSIPDGELVLLQMQTSWVFQGDEQRCLTGQGIHTDGADRAVLVVLDRWNIDESSACNAIYRDLDGKDAVIKPFVLGKGDALFWKDNKVYHHVEPARAKKGCGRRTVIIAHYPATHYITGEQNQNNQLGSKEAPTKHVSFSDSLPTHHRGMSLGNYFHSKHPNANNEEKAMVGDVKDWESILEDIYV